MSEKTLSKVPAFILETSWQQVLKDELVKPYMIELAAFVEKERLRNPTGIFPPEDLVFNALNQTPFNKVQVVIVGQDPYHGPGQAHGLCFSVPKGVPLPPSLQNVFKELHADVNIAIPKDGYLLPWAKQGILLLNATLTVQSGQALSHHGKGWEQFTDAIIKKLIEREDPIIFVLWGKSAQDKCKFLKDQKTNRHFMLTAAHPSPLSAYNGFYGCRHFSKINEILIQQGKSPIQWSLET